MGDRSLATGLQSPPYPQFIGVPNPRRFCGWLCSAGFGYACASRTQPIPLILILSLTLVRRRGGGQHLIQTLMRHVDYRTTQRFHLGDTTQCDAERIAEQFGHRFHQPVERDVRERV